MKFCQECGHELVEEDCGIDGRVPFCPICKDYRFPTFNSAVSTVIFSPDKTKILMIQQYGKPFNILVAGYINKGENAKEALLREVREEVALDIVKYTYNDNVYFDKSNTLIHNYISYVDGIDFHLEDEVDSAAWFTIADAITAVKEHSLAQRFLHLALYKTGHTEALLQIETGRVYLHDHEGQLVGEILFPKKGDTCEITHTFVDPALRGLHIADALMKVALQCIEEAGLRALPICSYAVRYMQTHTS